MTTSVFARLGVYSAAQPQRPGRQIPGLAKPRQVGRGAAGNNGASVTDIARDNGALIGTLNGIHKEGIAETAINGRAASVRALAVYCFQKS
jgi:hypothetical protein